MSNYYEYTIEQWKKLIRTTELTEEFLTCYAPCFDEWIWAFISQYQNLSSNFIYRFRHSLNIKELLLKQRIHQNTILKYWDLFSPYQWDVLKNQYISEEFIMEYHTTLNLELKYVLKFQPHLSLKFIKDIFPLAYHGEYLPRNSLKKPIEIHETLMNNYHGPIMDMIKKHNKHLEEMNRVYASSPTKKKKEKK